MISLTVNEMNIQGTFSQRTNNYIVWPWMRVSIILATFAFNFSVFFIKFFPVYFNITFRHLFINN